VCLCEHCAPSSSFSCHCLAFLFCFLTSSNPATTVFVSTWCSFLPRPLWHCHHLGPSYPAIGCSCFAFTRHHLTPHRSLASTAARSICHRSTTWPSVTSQHVGHSHGLTPCSPTDPLPSCFSIGPPHFAFTYPHLAPHSLALTTARSIYRQSTTQPLIMSQHVGHSHFVSTYCCLALSFSIGPSHFTFTCPHLTLVSCIYHCQVDVLLVDNLALDHTLHPGYSFFYLACLSLI
jgi:hypothetical protein